MKKPGQIYNTGFAHIMNGNSFNCVIETTHHTAA